MSKVKALERWVATLTPTKQAIVFQKLEKEHAEMSAFIWRYKHRQYFKRGEA